MPSKILFILHLPPPVHGASMVGKYIQESRLINTEFEADYINLSTSEDLQSIGGIGPGKLVKLFKIQCRVAAALLKKKYDLCYMTLTSTGAGFYKDLMVVAILKLSGKKIIYHFHNKGIAAVEKKGLINALYKFVFKDTFSILLSPGLYADIEHYVPRHQVFFCPNGIPGPILNKNIAGANIQKNNQVCQLLFLGNMVVSKGPLVLLETCRILKEMSVSFECHFVGGWAEITPAEFQEKIDHYGLNGNVFAHGPKYGQEKQAFLEKCDVFVFPTFYHLEAYPLVLLEAMQNGLPVVSCPEGGIPDMVLDGETGFLVPQGNAELLAEKIKRLIDDPQLRIGMGTTGRQRFDAHFKLEKFESNMKNILADAISKAPVR